MKHINAYSTFIALILLVSGCATTRTDNARITAGPLTVSQPTPIPDLVAQIIATARNNTGPLSMDIRYCVRDCRVSDKPKTEYFQEPNASAMADWGNSSIQCSSAIPIEAALELALAPNLDFHVSPFSSPKPRISIGPPELVRDHPAIVRRTYKVPKNRAKMLAKLPARLSATGASMAYDPQSGLLNVIDDEQHSTVGELLDAVGAKQVIRNPQIPEI
ncbi:MAG: hypothetical protein EOL92_06285 [Bacteroidia bacterium]|nr:hypothetical protein [Bacteroidia bacterium]